MEEGLFGLLFWGGGYVMAGETCLQVARSGNEEITAQLQKQSNKGTRSGSRLKTLKTPFQGCFFSSKPASVKIG